MSDGFNCPNCGVNLLVCEGSKMMPPARGKAPTADKGQIGDLLSMCYDENLDDWESEFIGKMRANFEKYGDTMYISEKQMDKLKVIAAR